MATRFKTILDTLVTVLVAVAAGLLIWRQFVPPFQPQARPPVEDASGLIRAELATNVRGTGPVALVEFADFECQFCARHARDVEPQIAKAFVETGVVRQVFLNYPLGSHRQAPQASAAAQCAGSQGRFWEMREALFRNQSALQRADHIERARALGLDVRAFVECIDLPDTLSVIERHKQTAQFLGINMTPTFLVGLVQADGSVVLKKRINGATTFDDFRSAITDVAPTQMRGRMRDVDVHALASN
jgi:protein-disulfide isomerase